MNPAVTMIDPKPLGTDYLQLLPQSALRQSALTATKSPTAPPISLITSLRVLPSFFFTLAIQVQDSLA